MFEEYSMLKNYIFIPLFFFSQNAFAQISFPNIQVSDFPDMAEDLRDKLNRERYEQKTAPLNQVRQQNPISKLTFAPNAANRRANLRAFVANMRSKDPAGANGLEQMLSQQDVMGDIDNALRAGGLDPNNFSHALAIYCSTMWQVVNNDHSDLSAKTMSALGRQFQSISAQNLAIGRMTDIQRQNASESMLLQAVLISEGAKYVQDDPEKNALFVKSARKIALDIGLDIDGLTLSEYGFVPKNKKRSDASDAVPGGQQSGADGTQLASASAAKGGTGEGSGSGLLPGVLIAGLAGSTLAAAFLYGKNKGAKKGNG
jgi:hypothetical protein